MGVGICPEETLKFLFSLARDSRLLYNENLPGRMRVALEARISYSGGHRSGERWPSG